MQIDFQNIDTLQKQQWLTGAIGPRPIGLVSTIDKEGRPNLAPFSFFNVFSIDPPILIFSPLLRVRDSSVKHSFTNCHEIPEAVIHVVSHKHIHQVNLCGHEYGDGVDEFVKAGFTKQKASLVKPWMAEEIAIKFECRIIGMKTFGTAGGAGTICMAEVLVMHLDENVLDSKQLIDPLKLDPVARLGGDYYTRLTQANLFTMPKPGTKLGIGFDQLPEAVLKSTVLSANHLGQLAAFTTIPEVNESFDHIGMHYLLELPISEKRSQELHLLAALLIERGKTADAWQLLLREEVVLEPEEGMIVIDRMD